MSRLNYFILCPLSIALGISPLLAVVKAAEITTLPTIQVAGEKSGDEDKTSGSATSGYRSHQVINGALGQQDMRESPYSIEQVNSQQIANMQANTTYEALKYVPTVQTTTGASRITDYYNIRGFSASVWSYNMAVDGMRSFDITQPLEDKQSIEVLNGANSFLYGLTSPAGMINFVTKKPTDEAFASVTAGNAGGSQLYTQLDSGGPLGTTLPLTYRMDVVYGDKGTNGVEHQTNERYLLSTAIDWDLNEKNTLGLDAAVADRDLEYAQTLFMPSVKSGIPSAADGSKNWGAPYSYSKDNTQRIGLHLDSELTARTHLRSRLRYSDISREFLMTRQVWQDSDLNYKQRIDYQKEYSTTAKQANIYLDQLVETGPVLHKFIIGGSYDHVAYDYPVGGNGSGVSSTIYPANFYSSPGYAPQFYPTAGTATSRLSIYQSALLADDMAFNEKWSLQVGESYVHINDASWNSATLVSSNAYDKGEWTPSGALLFKPAKAWMTYLSYTEALQQGFVAPQTASNAGEVSAPFLGKQYELGTKGSIANMDLTLAYFHIRQASQMVADNYYSSNGEEVHKGWEATGKGKLTDLWTVGGGFTLFDARITSSTTALDKTPQGVAEKMGRLYSEYQIGALPGLTLTGGASYTGHAWVDSANTLSIPGYTLWDAGFRYEKQVFGQDLALLLSANNLTNKEYWTTRSGILYLGMPASYSLSARMAF